MKTAYRVIALLAAAVAGCDGLTYSLPEPPAVPAGVESRFDPAECGTVSGSITWTGDKPDVPPESVPAFNLSGIPAGATHNPNAPGIGKSGGVSSAVVFLRGVDPARAKPWDLPPVTVLIDDRHVYVRQGNGPGGRFGFVKAGQAVRFQPYSTANIVGVRANGAVFFSLVFPPDGKPVERVMPTPGRVDLTSASGQFWAAGELFISETPYFAQPDADGRFTFTDVPRGTYTLVVWHPNWHPGPADRDPETGAVSRRRYAAGVEKVEIVNTAPGRQTVTRVEFTMADFTPPAN